MVPAMVLPFSPPIRDIKQAAGTSLVVIIPAALMGWPVFICRQKNCQAKRQAGGERARRISRTHELGVCEGMTVEWTRCPCAGQRRQRGRLGAGSFRLKETSCSPRSFHYARLAFDANIG
ncbi:MAG: hypothetical protein MUF81_01115 [Verrucomicrobia bacterium]|nr:hypothetical protein [Verrucomicrobiota bacterium]